LVKTGEVELQTTYYDTFLSEIIADQDRNVALRWANKLSSEEESDIQPDAIISTLMQHDFGYPVGFGEVKPGNSSSTKHSYLSITFPASSHPPCIIIFNR
jgi:hypothetical protein